MKKKVLIVDDDTYICNLLENFLNQKGFTAECAYSGLTAIKKIKDKDFDLILCDFRLPDCDGFKILSVAKNKNLFTPVVIMTAYADIKMAVQLIKSGHSIMLQNQFTPKRFFNLLKKQLKPTTINYH